MANLLDLDQLRTFLAIADAGSFTSAATHVHRTQSAVSMQMRKLEERVGKSLFERDGRNVRLTEAGEHMVHYARRLMRLNDETVAAFNDTELTGSVYLGTPDDYAERFLPEILARFARSNPRVEVNVVCEESEVLFKSVKANKLDLAIVTHCADTESATIFRREPLFWVASRQHDAEVCDPLPLSLSQPSCEWRRLAVNKLDEIGRAYRIVYSSRNSTAIMAAVLAGLAITTVPESGLRPGIKILGEAEGFPSLPMCDIGLVRNWQRVSPATDALAGHVVSALGNLSVPVAAE